MMCENKYKLLNIKEFFPLIENIAADDEDCNYKINLMQFIYDQIKNNSQLSFKEISPSIVELLKKMTVDENNFFYKKYKFSFDYKI